MVIENRDRFSNENGAAHCPDNHFNTELGGIAVAYLDIFVGLFSSHSIK